MTNMRTLVHFWAMLVFVQSYNIQDLPRLLPESPVNFKNPTLVNFDQQVGKSSWISFAKTVFKTKALGTVKVLSLDSLKSQQSEPMIFPVSDNADNLIKTLELIDSSDLGSELPVLIVVPSLSVLQSLIQNIRINQEVLILDWNTLSLHEMYRVTEVNVITKIGSYTSSFRFDYSDPTWSSDIGERRSNFFGSHFVAMYDADPPYGYLNPAFKTKAKFFENNQTYLVTDYATTGMFLELFRILSKQLNFTYTLYKRLDGAWGTVTNNVSSGMISNIGNGNADIGAIGFGMTTERGQVVNFLPTVHWYLPSIFIRTELPEALDYNLAFSPFALDLWLGMSFISIVIATLLFLANDKRNWKSMALNFMTWLWLAFSVNFGGNQNSAKLKKIPSNRIILFFCLLGGTIIWIGYRASITSDLSVIKIVYPFNDLESFTKTEFTMGALNHGTAAAETFTKATPGSVYEKIYQNHMKTDDSFVPVVQGLEHVINKDSYAYFEDKQLILAATGFDCKIEMVWESSSPLFSLTFPVKKKWPFKRTLQWKVQKLREIGVIDLLASQYLKKPPKCKPPVEPAKALSLKKLFTLFLIIAIGCMAATLIFTLELTTKSKKKLPKEDKFIPGLEIICNHLAVLREELQKQSPEAVRFFDTMQLKELLTFGRNKQ